MKKRGIIGERSILLSVIKFVLVSFVKSSAMEYGGYNIRINMVSPGSVATKA